MYELFIRDKLREVSNPNETLDELLKRLEAMDVKIDYVIWKNNKIVYVQMDGVKHVV